MYIPLASFQHYSLRLVASNSLSILELQRYSENIHQWV